MNQQEAIKRFKEQSGVSLDISGKDVSYMGDLFMSDEYIDTIPENFTAYGCLLLKRNPIKEIKNVIVYGFLDLEGSTVEILENVTVYGYLNLEGSNVTKLKNVTVQGSVYLEYSKLKELINVSCMIMFCSNTHINQIKGLNIDFELYINESTYKQFKHEISNDIEVFNEISKRLK